MIDQKVLYKKLEEINEVLKKDSDNNHIGVLAGISGRAMFHFYYARLIEDDEVAEIGVDIISEIVEKINSGYAYPTYCTGITGAAWVIDFLNNEGFIEIDTDEFLSELDAYVFDVMKNDIEKEDYDFLHGALGYAYYFLKRYESTDSVSLKNIYSQYLHFFIKSIADSSTSTAPDYLFWETISEEETVVNISLSHGMSSIMNFLSRLYQYDDFKTVVTPLIEGSVSYLLKHKSNDDNTLSMFPNVVCETRKTEYASRLAWCYGDLGIGITLWQVGKRLNNNLYTAEALDILKRTTKRRVDKETNVKDVGICHGAIGIMSMYNNIYKETKDPIFKEAMDFWMSKSLEMGKHDDGLAGFLQFVANKEGKGEWAGCSNLLEGISGIGLCIISYLDALQTNWEECLMIN